MESKRRAAPSYILIFIIISYLAVLSMSGIALIPRTYIQENLEESAIYLTTHEEHFKHYVIDGVDASILDEVADANLLNIAACYDEKDIIGSAILCKWYFIGYGDGKENNSFYEVVFEGQQPNNYYFRYWHGSLVLIRPMLLIWNIQQIYAVDAVVMLGLFLLLIALMIRSDLKVEAIFLTVSMIAVSAWFVPWCLEYTWTFLLMLVVSIIALKRAIRDKKCYMLFFITGMITIFLDFFTTELLTLLIPLLLVLRIRERKNQFSAGEAVKSCILWGVGYICMWTEKWIIAFFYLGKDAFQVVYNRIQNHTITNGQTQLWLDWKEMLKCNLKCLFPFNYGMTVTVIVMAFLAVGIIVLVVLGWKGYISGISSISYNSFNSYKKCLVYIGLGLLPYLRYMVICHHSWQHYFFTFRAQAASILAVCFAITESKVKTKGGPKL